MIAKEFLSELWKVHPQFEWALVPDVSRMPERRSGTRLRLRGTYKHPQGEFVFGPIGALCFIRTGEVYGADAWIEAANAIELSLIDAGDLTASADDRTWANLADRRNPISYIQQLRTLLLASVGLETKP